MHAAVLRMAMLVTLALSIVFLLALAFFEVLPVTNGNNDLVISQQSNFQLARMELLMKDVYALAYRGPATQARAVGDLQTQIPAFEQAQKGLMNGDALLGLPPNPSPGVKQALLAAQTDFDSMVAAMKLLRDNADKPADLVQVSIIEQHERPYLAAMYPITILFQQEAQQRTIQLLIIKITLIVLTIFLIILKYLLFTQKAIKKIIEEEEAVKQAYPP